MIFRPHRGSLEESMKCAVEFDSELSMKEHVVEQFFSQFTVEDVVIGERVSKDNRIGWEDSRVVGLNKHGRTDYIKLYGTPQAIGYCATKYSK